MKPRSTDTVKLWNSEDTCLLIFLSLRKWLLNFVSLLYHTWWWGKNSVYPKPTVLSFGLGTSTCIVFLNVTLSLECWYAQHYSDNWGSWAEGHSQRWTLSASWKEQFFAELDSPVLRRTFGVRGPPTSVLQSLGGPGTPAPRWAGGRALPGENSFSHIVTAVSFRAESWDWVSLTQKLWFFFRTILPTTLLNCAPSKYIWICNSVRPFLCSRMGNSVAYFTYTLFDWSFACPNIVPLVEGKTGSLDPRSRGCVSFILLSSVPSSGEGVNLCW